MWVDFEGIDGSGKTTLSLRAARRLRDLGMRVYHVREHGAFRSRVPGRIRDVTRDPESVLLSPQAELLLNAAREAQLLAEEIRPALARGEVVITDRALPSHEAVARAVRGLPVKDIQSVVRFAAGGLWPDLVIYVDVDPDVARLRKRLRKIREKRFGPPGRKGLLGQSYARLARAAFLAMAAEDPQRWRVLDNSFRTASEAEGETLALLAPVLRFPAPRRAPAPSPHRVAPADSLGGWVRRFFEFVEDVSVEDPPLAALFTAGMDHPVADRIRAGAVERDPDIAVWTISGLDTPGAWELRAQAAEEAPFHVARSLAGLEDPRAWELRASLAGRVPDQVLHSLGGLSGPEAHAMRDRLWSASPEEGLRSLAGLSDSSAWRFRARSMRDGLSAALAESLSGIALGPAWILRENMRPLFPLSVLRSLKRIDDPRAWPIREDLSEFAPRIVLDTLLGFAGPEAEALRTRLQDRFPEEVAASLSGLDTPEAWRRRHDLLDAAPDGVVSSLYGFGGDPLAGSFVENALARGGGQPLLVRRAVLFHLKKSRPLSATPFLS